MRRSQFSCCGNHVSAAHPPWGKSSPHGLSCCWRFWCWVKKGDKMPWIVACCLFLLCWNTAKQQVLSGDLGAKFISYIHNHSEPSYPHEYLHCLIAQVSLHRQPTNILNVHTCISTQQVLSECHFPALCVLTQLVRWSARPKQWAFVFWNPF